MVKDIEIGFDKRILVIGDVMLDEYVVGNKYRMSDEAPVPVLKVDDFKVKLGGAANVANNVKMLGCDVLLCGAIGQGYSAERFFGLLKEQQISSDYIVASPNNLTTTKTRVLIDNQQIVRYDYERLFLTDAVIESVYEKLKSINYNEIDAVIIEDYDKGIVCSRIMELVKRLASCPIIVDPKSSNIDLYHNVTCIKPNRHEFIEIMGLEDSDMSVDWLCDRGKQMVKKLSLKHLVVTLGEEGAFVCDGKKCRVITGYEREIANTIGAGDTFIAALAVSYVSEFDIFESVELANLAASIAVSKEYTNVCSAEELKNFYDD